MMDEEPTLDYWMIAILEASVKKEIKKRSAGWPADFVRKQLEERNEWGTFGQLQLILDRLNEMKVHTDKVIKDALVAAGRKSK